MAEDIASVTRDAAGNYVVTKADGTKYTSTNAPVVSDASLQMQIRTVQQGQTVAVAPIANQPATKQEATLFAQAGLTVPEDAQVYKDQSGNVYYTNEWGQRIYAIRGDVQPTPAPPITKQQVAPTTVEEAKEQGWMGVDTKYAEQNPESVVKIGDAYYTPPVTASVIPGEYGAGWITLPWKIGEEGWVGQVAGEEFDSAKAQAKIVAAAKAPPVQPAEKLGEVTTETGEKVTGVLPNVGWVMTESGNVRDPKAYADFMGHDIGYYGFTEAKGQVGQDIPYQKNFNELPPEKQYKWMVENGKIPTNTVFIPGSKEHPEQWTYMITGDYYAGVLKERGEIAQLKSDEELWDTLTTKGWDAYKEVALSRLPEKYQDIGKKQGFDVAMEAYDADIKRMKELPLTTAVGSATMDSYEIFVKALREGKSLEEATQLANEARQIAVFDIATIALTPALVELFIELVPNGKSIIENYKTYHGVYTEEGLKQYFDKNADSNNVGHLTRDGKQFLLDAGYTEEQIKAAEIYYLTFMGVPVPPEGVGNYYQNRLTGELYTEAQYAQLVKDYEAKSSEIIEKYGFGSDEWFALGTHPSNYIALADFSSIAALTREYVNPVEWANATQNWVNSLPPAIQPIVGPLIVEVAAGAAGFAAGGFLGGVAGVFTGPGAAATAMAGGLVGAGVAMGGTTFLIVASRIDPETGQQFTTMFDVATGKIIESQEALREWAESNRPDSFVGSIPYVGKNILSGMYDMVSAIGAQIPLVVVGSGTLPSAEQVGAVASLGAGMLVWPLSMVYEAQVDPLTGVPRIAGVTLTFVLPVAIKGTYEIARSPVDVLRGIYPEASLKVDIAMPRADIPPELGRKISLMATQLAQDVATRMREGKLPWTDQTLVDPESGVVIRITPYERASAIIKNIMEKGEKPINITYSVQATSKWFKELLEDNKIIEAEAPKDSALKKPMSFEEWVGEGRIETTKEGIGEVLVADFKTEGEARVWMEQRGLTGRDVSITVAKEKSTGRVIGVTVAVEPGRRSVDIRSAKEATIKGLYEEKLGEGAVEAPAKEVVTAEGAGRYIKAEVPESIRPAGRFGGGAGYYGSDSLWLQRVESALGKEGKAIEVADKPMVMAIEYNKLLKIGSTDKTSPLYEVQKLLDKGDVLGATRLFFELDNKGLVPPGVYEVPKTALGGKIVEREQYISSNTKLEPVLDSSGRLATQYVRAERNLYRTNYDGTQVEVVKVGEEVPIYFMKVEGAMGARAPSIIQRAFTEYVTLPYQTMKRLLKIPESKMELGLGYGGVMLPELKGLILKHKPSPYDFIEKSDMGFFRPGTGDSIVVESRLTKVPEVLDKQSIVDTYSKGDLGLTVGLKKGLTAEELKTVERVVVEELGKTKSLDYQGILGYPNPKNPDYLLLAVKDMKTLAELVDLQKRINTRLNELGIGDVAKIKPDVVGVREIDGVLTGDVFDKEGNIIKQAPTQWNKDVGGTIRRRVTAVVVDEAGRLLLVTDHMEPQGYYSLPGGNLVVEHLLPGAEKFKVEDAAFLQVQSEVGFGIKDMERLPSYLGQANRHSLPGSYVVKGKAESTKIDIDWFVREHADMAKDPALPAKLREQYSTVELREGVWWDGKTPIEVSPATYDIVVKLAKEGELKGVDITKISISDKTPIKLLTARDNAYYRPKDLSVGGVDIAKLGFEPVVRIQPDITLGELKPRVTIEEKMALSEDLMRNQPKETTTLKFEEPKLGEIKTIDKAKAEEITARLREERAKTGEAQARASISEVKTETKKGVGEYGEYYKEPSVARVELVPALYAYGVEEYVVTPEERARVVAIAEEYGITIESPDMEYVIVQYAKAYGIPLERAVAEYSTMRYGEGKYAFERYQPPYYQPTQYQPIQYMPTRYQPTQYQPTQYQPTQYPPEYTPPPLPPPPPPPPPAPPVLLPEEKVSASKPQDISPGTVTWRQGRKWVVIPPPYEQEDVYYLDEPPPGIYKYATGKGSAYKTVQILGYPSGQAFTDEPIDIDIGWARVYIPAGKEPEITFTGGKEAAEERWAAEQSLEGTREYGEGDIITSEERLVPEEEKILPGVTAVEEMAEVKVSEAEDKEKIKGVGIEVAETEESAVSARERADKRLAQGQTLEGTREYGLGDIITSQERLLPGVSEAEFGDSVSSIIQGMRDTQYVPETEEEEEENEDERKRKRRNGFGEEVSFGEEINIGEVNLGREIDLETSRSGVAAYTGEVGLEKPRLRKLREVDGVNVYEVDGEYIREKIDKDFEKGGHDKVYGYIKPDEIWVEFGLSDEEREAIIQHEKTERDLMVSGMGYQEAHERANKTEAKVKEVEGKTEENAKRDEPKANEERLSDVGSLSKAEEIAPVSQYAGMPTLREATKSAMNRERVRQFRNGTKRARRHPVIVQEPYLPERYYLGRKLRPTDVNMSL